MCIETEISATQFVEKERHILILATIRDFLEKFEKNDVKILKETGYSIHYACNIKDDMHYFDEEEVNSLGADVHHVDIELSPTW